MSYHDGYRPQGIGPKNNSKSNYYDELDFWISKCKNLTELLSVSRDHLNDYELVLSKFVSLFEGDDFDHEHLKEVQKFLRILEQEVGDKK